MLKLNNNLFNTIEQQALANPRHRMHYDLRDGIDEQSQRMLNVLEPDTVIPIHRHTMTSEVVVVLRGKVREVFFNDKGEETDSQILEAGSDCSGCVVPIAQWHTCECLTPGSVIFEAKATKYDPNTTEEILEISNKQ